MGSYGHWNHDDYMSLVEILFSDLRIESIISELPTLVQMFGALFIKRYQGISELPTKLVRKSLVLKCIPGNHTLEIILT
jgi:hypothetical protein